MSLLSNAVDVTAMRRAKPMNTRNAQNRMFAHRRAGGQLCVRLCVQDVHVCGGRQ